MSLWIGLSFLPQDNGKVAIAGRAGIQIWDIECIHELLGHTASVCSIDFTANGKYLLSSSEDGTVKLWDIMGQGRVITTLGS